MQKVGWNEFGKSCSKLYENLQKVAEQLVENPRPLLIEKNNEFTFCFAIKFLKIKKHLDNSVARFSREVLGWKCNIFKTIGHYQGWVSPICL